jgi:replication-associated recombination protein RarA
MQAHAVSYLAEAPKSTRSYNAYARAEAAAKEDMTAPVPMAVRNAPTKLMAELGYGETYKYNPEYRYVTVFKHLFLLNADSSTGTLSRTSVFQQMCEAGCF